MRALLIVDVIKDFEHEDGDRLRMSFRQRHGGLIRALAEARRASDPVVYANDGAGVWDVPTLIRRALEGQAGDLVRQLVPRGREPLFLKAHYSAFEDTPLAHVLEEMDVTEIALAGTATEMCVFQTACDGLRNGLDVAVLADACASVDEHHEVLALAYLKEVRGVRILHEQAADPAVWTQRGGAKFPSGALGSP